MRNLKMKRKKVKNIIDAPEAKRRNPRRIRNVLMGPQRNVVHLIGLL
jgi:hypothetical protein